MNDDDNIYGPYTLPEVTIKPEKSLEEMQEEFMLAGIKPVDPNNPATGQANVTMSPIEYLLGGTAMRAGSRITTIKDIIKNKTRLGVNKDLDKMTKKMQEYAEVAQKIGSGYNALSMLERAFNTGKSNEALMMREPIIGADPYSPQYSGEGYRTIDGKVYSIPETELDYIIGPIFSGDLANPNFPSKFSLLEKSIEIDKQKKRNE